MHFQVQLIREGGSQPARQRERKKKTEMERKIEIGREKETGRETKRERGRREAMLHGSAPLFPKILTGPHTLNRVGGGGGLSEVLFFITLKPRVE